MTMGTHEILHGDVREWLQFYPDDYFDACLCDPPYLLEFMGKAFDRQHKKMKGEYANDGQRMQAWHETWAREVIRVMKPGAHVLAFGGTRTYHRLSSAVEDMGFEVRDMLEWLHAQGFPKGKTQLKPAHEPIVLARKPGANGYLALDACRVAYEFGGTAASNPLYRKEAGYKIGVGSDTGSTNFSIKPDGGELNPNPSGRWPANLILSHSHEDGDSECHPDCPVTLLDEQSGRLRARGNTSPTKRKAKSWFTGSHRDGETDSGDSGGASRFFYCAKVSTRERNLGGITCNHPTLKPISLTTYLSRLLLPPPHSDLSPRRLLVPFSGAGSEIAGALIAGWDDVIGIEQDLESITWAEARIPAALLAHQLGVL